MGAPGPPLDCLVLRLDSPHSSFSLVAWSLQEAFRSLLDRLKGLIEPLRAS